LEVLENKKLVDLGKGKVYKLSENGLTEPQVYGKDETVKVGIFEDLKISLHDIFNCEHKG
jgi:hypothetical protein